MLRRKLRAGFTLIELMIVVAIIGILATTAIPSYMRYIRRAKTVEATMNIRRMYDSTVAYYVVDHVTATGAPIPKQFPQTASWSPTLNFCCTQRGGKCAPNPTFWKQGGFATATWQALNFSVDDPFYYSYSAERQPAGTFGTNVGDQFWLEASGNLDCDAFFSLFMRPAIVAQGGTIQGGSAIFERDPLE